MLTKLYDTSKSEPPSGWLKCGRPIPDNELDTWKDVVAKAMRAMASLDKSSRYAEELTVAPEFWGLFGVNGLLWISRCLPCGRDRTGRPGRLLFSIFSARHLHEFDWAIIWQVSRLMESVSQNQGTLSEIQGLLDLTAGQSVEKENTTFRQDGLSQESLRQLLATRLADIRADVSRFLAISKAGEVERDQPFYESVAKPTASPSPGETPRVSVDRVQQPPRKQPNRIIQIATHMNKVPMSAVCAILGLIGGFVVGHYLVPTASNLEGGIPIEFHSESRTQAYTRIHNELKYLEENDPEITRDTSRLQPSTPTRHADDQKKKGLFNKLPRNSEDSRSESGTLRGSNKDLSDESRPPLGRMAPARE